MLSGVALACLGILDLFDVRLGKRLGAGGGEITRSDRSMEFSWLLLSSEVVDPYPWAKLGDFPGAGLLGSEGFCVWGEKTGSLV
jgi:hypothetical protein